MEQIEQTALVLEGGGMRGVFTAGVLDLFMERNVEFPYTIGVSAGATNGVSYMSKQIGRSLYADTKLICERDYISLKTFMKRGEFIDMDLLFNEFPNLIYPLDWDSYSNNSNLFEIVTTDIRSGEACYFRDLNSIEDLTAISMASCSLPLLNKVVHIEGTPMLDGGLSNSIPLDRAYQLGYKKAIVVLTQCRGYRKRERGVKIPKWLFPKYPKVAELLNDRAKRYNQQLEWIEQLERNGRISVLRPTSLMNVGRLSTNQKDIKKLHQHGYEVAAAWLEEQLDLF